MSRDLALLGLPHAGKTSWLGRLWISADTGSGRLTKVLHPSDLDALNQLSDWLYDCRYPQRSPMDNAPEFKVDLRWAGQAATLPFTLHISDYSGEQVNRIYTTRDAAWTAAWDARANASGLAILIRPDQLRPPRASRLQRAAPTMDEAAALLGARMMPDQDNRDASEADALPTGLALVELLQLLRSARGLAMGELPDPSQYRITVILSAWDAVLKETPQMSPAEFLHRRLGLLDDFLATNYAPEGLKVFGLSTTGDNLEDPVFLAKYQEGDPQDFGFVCWDGPDGVRRDADVTLPLGWLLEGDAALP